MNCVLCGKNSEHICLQCCVNYAVQAGANRHKVTKLLREKLMTLLKIEEVTYCDRKQQQEHLGQIV